MRQQLNLAPCLEPDIQLVVMLREFNSPAENTLGQSITAIVELRCWLEGLLALTPSHYARLSQLITRRNPAMLKKVPKSPSRKG